MLEAYTTLGFLAAHTERARLLTVITGVHYRAPGLLAKAVTTLDVLSGGRAILGIGAGWNEEESRGLGFAFPAALGAKLGRPGDPVLAIHGDGGFLMNAQELETAVRHGIAVVTVVMNNNCWGSEKAYQKQFYGGRYIGCDIGNPRYDEYARIFGAQGYYVEHPDDADDV